MKTLTISTLLAVALTGCSTGVGPDFTPLGNGLSLIGLGLVLSAIIRTLGSQLSKPTPKLEEHTNEKPQ